MRAVCVCGDVFIVAVRVFSLLPVGPQSFKRGKEKRTHTYTHIGRNCRRKRKREREGD